MEKGEITVKVNTETYPSGEMIVKVYLPYPGLAIHRYVADYPFNASKATRWHKWKITHIKSGLAVNSGYFRRFADALLACKMIADMLPWTLSSRQLINRFSNTHKWGLVRMIVHYAEEGYNEAQISSLVLESELESG
jgi:hypothetical protein